MYLFSAVLDVNGINISSADVREHLLEQIETRASDETIKTSSEQNVKRDTVYMIPRGSKPANEYFNPELLLGIFLTLFPYGCGALEDNSRLIKINFQEHIRYLPR